MEYTLDELAMILCHKSEASCHVDDLYTSIRRYDAFSDKAIAQAAYLSETRQFRQWLQGLGSDFLLVDGHCENHTTRRTSPLSLFLASLIQSLLDRIGQQQSSSQSSSDVVLYFFCGQHMEDDGPLAGPQGLIRSLTTQLILSWPQGSPPPDVGFLSSLLPGPVASAEEDLEVVTVCRIFHALLRQLPPSSTVHCIIDGISYFETSIGGWSEDVYEVSYCLQRCCSPGTANDPRPTVKLMLASADKSIEVRDLFPQDCVVELRTGNFYSSVVSPRALISDLRGQASFSQLVADDDSDREYATASKRQFWND